jgi:hypothetical protein
MTHNTEVRNSILMFYCHTSPKELIFLSRRYRRFRDRRLACLLTAGSQSRRYSYPGRWPGRVRTHARSESGSALSTPQSERPHSAAHQFERLRQRAIRWRDGASRVRYCTQPQFLPLRLPYPERRPTSGQRGVEGLEGALVAQAVT